MPISACTTLIAVLRDFDKFSYAETCQSKADIFCLGDKGSRIDIAIGEAFTWTQGRTMLMREVARALPSESQRRALEHAKQQLDRVLDGKLFQTMGKDLQDSATAVRDTVAGMVAEQAPVRA